MKYNDKNNIIIQAVAYNTQTYITDHFWWSKCYQENQYTTTYGVGIFF